MTVIVCKIFFCYLRVCVFTGKPFVVDGLGVKVDQGLPCVRHYIPRSGGKPL